MPSSTARPAASASAVFGWMPIPATMLPAGIARPALGRDRELSAALGQADGAFAGQHLDPFLPVVGVEELHQVGGEHPVAHARAGGDQGHGLAVHRQRGSDFGADEAAADDHRPLALARGRAQAAVVVQGAKVDDAVAAKRQAAGRAAGRQQQLAIRVDAALVVAHLAGRDVEGLGGAPQMQRHPVRREA